MKPIAVEVFMPLPEGWGICLSCEAILAQANLGKAPHERGLDEYPPEWRADFQRFSGLIQELSLRYGSSILMRIWDPRSLQGLIKAIRYGVRRYPTFVVERKRKITGFDLLPLDQALQDAGAGPITAIKG